MGQGYKDASEQGTGAGQHYKYRSQQGAEVDQQYKYKKLGQQGKKVGQLGKKANKQDTAMISISVPHKAGINTFRTNFKLVYIKEYQTKMLYIRFLAVSSPWIVPYGLVMEIRMQIAIPLHPIQHYKVSNL